MRSYLLCVTYYVTGPFSFKRKELIFDWVIQTDRLQNEMGWMGDGVGWKRNDTRWCFGNGLERMWGRFRRLLTAAGSDWHLKTARESIKYWPLGEFLPLMDFSCIFVHYLFFQASQLNVVSITSSACRYIFCNILASYITNFENFDNSAMILKKVVWNILFFKKAAGHYLKYSTAYRENSRLTNSMPSPPLNSTGLPAKMYDIGFRL